MQWITETGPVDYQSAVSFMEQRVADIAAGSEEELVWLVEHPPLYTAGTSSGDDELLSARFPVYKTGRGGRYTYHGPGQRVAYVMKNLRQEGNVPDIRKYVSSLEEWIIRSLSEFGINGGRQQDKVGIWVDADGGIKKIAAIGVRVRRWITYHGIAVNVDPDLSHFSGIVPCGIREHGVTSVSELLGRRVGMEEFDQALKRTWSDVF